MNIQHIFKAGMLAISCVTLLSLGGCLSPNIQSSVTDSVSGSVTDFKNTYGPYPEAVDPDNFNPGYYMSVGHRDSIATFRTIADNSDFVGVKKRYLWVDLEPEKGEYDFSEIESDLEYLQSIGKQLWISISVTTWVDDMSPRVPKYMWNNSRYGCGENGRFYGAFRRTAQKGGWLPCRGNQAFDKRVKALFAALGEQFNSNPGFEGINLGETSTGGNPNFSSPEEKMEVFKSYALAAKRAFPNKTVMQMINYAEFDLEEFADWLVEQGIATGGPDVHVARAEEQLATAYSIHKKNHMATPNGIDVQWDNWDKGGIQYSSSDLLETAIEYVNPWYMFWTRKPGLFREDVVKALNEYGPLPSVDDFWSGSESSD